MRKWRTIGRHKWVVDAVITESISVADDSIRRYTATICGYRGWRLYEGRGFAELGRLLFEKVKEIRNRIEAGDNSVFDEDVSIINPQQKED